MKKIYFLGFSLLFIANIAKAQTPEFKKAMESGNQKYKIKSYNLAIMDYDAAIKSVSADVDKLIASKTTVPADKKYILEAYEKRANCAFYTKNYPKMNGDVDKLLALDSSNTNAKALKSLDKYKTGKKAEGCTGMKSEALKGNEIAAQAYKECFCNNEGIILAKEGTSLNSLKKYDEALVKLDQALLIIPDSGFVHGEKGKALIGKENYPDALKSLNTAVSLSKKDYKTYYSRAQVYLKLNQLDSAMEDMNLCLKLKPTFYEGYLLRADIAEKKELWSAAIFDLKNCIKMKPLDNRLDYRVAVILHTKQDDLFEACPYYKSAKEKGSENAVEMATNCDNIKYMKDHLKNSKKEKMTN